MKWDNIDWIIVLQRGALILAVWLVIYVLRRFILKWIRAADRRIDLFELCDKDIRILTWIVDFVLLVIGLGVTLSILQLTSLLLVGHVGPRIAGLAVTWIVVWMLVRYLSCWIQALDKKIEEIDIDQRDLKTMDRLIDGVIVLVGIIASLAILNVTSLLYSALTAAGVFSVIIGLAVKDIAANFLAGIFLLIDRPFVVGDSIQVKGYAGAVSKISLRSTTIKTFDGPIVTIPNSTISVEPTLNYTLSENRRILFTVSVLNSADLNQAIQTIQEALEAESRLLPDIPPSILVNQIREYAVEFQVIAYSSSKDLFDTQSDLQKEIVGLFSQKGIELAVPIRVNLPGPFQQNA
ncbi:MAG: mechanosensitive ion channel family protein [Anaerolineales bacterium]|nr:mechanosensitive ion channel family protein [Anaerolineales bacterium]